MCVLTFSFSQVIHSQYQDASTDLISNLVNEVEVRKLEFNLRPNKVSRYPFIAARARCNFFFTFYFFFSTSGMYQTCAQLALLRVQNQTNCTSLDASSTI